MSIGLTLGTGPILTKIVSSWFYAQRGLTLGIVSSAGSFGALVLVPASSIFLVLFDWRDAYYFLSGLLLLIVLPCGVWLIRNRPQDVGMEPLGDTTDLRRRKRDAEDTAEELYGRDATLGDVLGSNLFYRLTFGYFV
jgi:sugar phosphate permease